MPGLGGLFGMLKGFGSRAGQAIQNPRAQAGLGLISGGSLLDTAVAQRQAALDEERRKQLFSLFGDALAPTPGGVQFDPITQFSQPQSFTPTDRVQLGGLFGGGF